MTLFLQERGCVLDLLQPGSADPETSRHTAHDVERNVAAATRGVALRMTFEGVASVPRKIGEQQLSGHHNYFLGCDESRWRTDVPLYGAVRYENLYPGIDLRLRESNGVPEYDLLLASGADLMRVIVHVEGAEHLAIKRRRFACCRHWARPADPSHAEDLALTGVWLGLRIWG